MIEVFWTVPEPQEDYPRRIRRAAEAALAYAGRAGDAGVRVLSGDDIRELNRAFRHNDAVTDVLTFPSAEGEALLTPPDAYLGDIAVCFVRAAEQAAALGHSLGRELSFLAVHGALHLCGYDHIDKGDERRMRAAQTEILSALGVER